MAGERMKLLDIFHHMLDGMGQGQTVPRVSRHRPEQGDELSSHLLQGKVARVIIETWDTGPFPTDLCWLLVDDRDHIVFVVPTGTVLSEDLIDQVGDGMGFDKPAMRQAMRSTRNARFTVWQRDRIADAA
jgi:hypothetical protein